LRNVEAVEVLIYGISPYRFPFKHRRKSPKSKYNMRSTNTIIHGRKRPKKIAGRERSNARVVVTDDA
jgi:hypothetical protein